MKTISDKLVISSVDLNTVYTEITGSYVGTFRYEEVAAEFVELHNAQYDAEQNVKATDPHAKIKAEYAKLAEIHAEPWLKLIIMRHGDGIWHDCTSEPLWLSKAEYRIRPTTPITVNGITVPEPVRHRLKDGVEYLLVDLWKTEPPFVDNINWSSHPSDLIWLERGLIHLDPEAAALHGEAMIAPSKIDKDKK